MSSTRRLFLMAGVAAVTTFLNVHADEAKAQATAQPEAKTSASAQAATPPTATQAASPTAATPQATPAAAEASFTQADVNKISEAFGHLIGKNLDNPGFRFDMESIIKGMRDAAVGKPSPMSEEEYEKSLTMIQEAIFNEMAQKNLQEANSFFTKNAEAVGVIEVETGKLQYKVQQAGTGAEVKSHGAPIIHYTGRYADGTVFGSSLDNGEPVTLSLDHTIPGFSKGLVGMKEGEKRTLYIHPDLGYGTAGHLPPNSLLVFEVEIMKVGEDSAAQVQAQATMPQSSAADSEKENVSVHANFSANSSQDTAAEESKSQTANSSSAVR